MHSDPHLNVFHAYRGSAVSDEARTRQLEDNLTRALAITLGQISSDDALTTVLSAFPIDSGSAVRFRGCLLQVGSSDERWPSKRHLVVVHGGPQLRRTSTGESEMGRPDAVLLGDEWLLAIESKLGDSVSERQLDAHRRTLGIENTEIGDVTWGELAARARAAQRLARTELERFLLQQFEEYLRMNGFGGLTHDHFAYFATAPEERRLVPGIKDGIVRLLGELAERIRLQSYPNWSAGRRGNIRDTDTGAWLPLEPPGATRRMPHLTVYINASTIGLIANVETAGPHAMFRSAWQRDPIRLISYFRSLAGDAMDADPWVLTVRRRTQIQASIYRDDPSLILSARTAVDLPDETLCALIDATTAKPDDRRLGVPQISLAREYPAARALSDPDGITDLLVADAARTRPFFEWIGTTPNSHL